MRVGNRLFGPTASTFGRRPSVASCAGVSASGLKVTVTSARRLRVISRSIALAIRAGTAKMPTLATASASVRTASAERALRRVRSVMDLRRIADMTASSRRVHDAAVADRDHPVGARGELEVVRDVHDRRALIAYASQQLEHLRRGLRVEVA